MCFLVWGLISAKLPLASYHTGQTIPQNDTISAGLWTALESIAQTTDSKIILGLAWNPDSKTKESLFRRQKLPPWAVKVLVKKKMRQETRAYYRYQLKKVLDDHVSLNKGEADIRPPEKRIHINPEVVDFIKCTRKTWISYSQKDLYFYMGKLIKVFGNPSDGIVRGVSDKFMINGHSFHVHPSHTSHLQRYQYDYFQAGIQKALKDTGIWEETAKRSMKRGLSRG